jgi:arylsulfatase A-like enzyme
MTSSRPDRLPRAGSAATVGLLLFAGCTEREPVKSESASLSRLEVEPATADVPSRDPVTVEQIVVDPEVPPKHPSKSKAHTIARSTGKDPEVDISGPFDPSSFNQIVLHLRCPGEQEVKVALSRDGTLLPLGDALKKQVPPRKAAQTVIFDVPMLRRQTLAVDTISVTFVDARKGSTLLSLELRQRPWSDWLPDARKAAEMVAIGGEARRAEGLSSRLPLVTSFRSIGGGSLEFSYGEPDTLREPASAPVLVAALSSPGGTKLEREFELESDPSHAPGWKHASIDVSRFDAGKEVAARFSLRTSSEEEIVCALGEPRLVQRAKNAPVVVLVTSDTHRADYLGTAHSPISVRTPFLDGLAARGVYFTNCLSSANVTNPSHVALMTGTSPRDTGVVANQKPLPPEVQTLAESFRAAGFTCYAAVCAIHLNHRQSGLGQGFDRMSFPEIPQRDSGLAIADLESWLPDAEGLPLFVWLHVFDAHAPYLPREPYHATYWDASRDPADPSLPPLPDAAADHWLGEVRDLGYVETLYRSEVSYVDAEVERFLGLPRMHDAIVAFTADHGESFGSHQIYWDHRELYPENLYVPLILAGPGVPEGIRCDRPVEQIDTSRTLLDLAGLSAAAFPGSDLLRIAAGEGKESSARFALSAHALSASVLSGNLFLVIHLREHKFTTDLPPRAMHEIELYDLARDPRCEVNLAQSDHETAARLRKMLVDWLGAAHPPQPGTADPEAVDSRVIEDLQALGYGGETGEEQSSRWIDPACECEQCKPFHE